MTTPDFRAFDLQHLVALAAIAVSCLLVAWKARSPRVRRVLARIIGLLLLGYAAVFYIQQGIKGWLSWEYSLPLELCNLVLIACIVSLFRPRQFVTELAYFWGLGGVLQATLTPDLAAGFPSWDFIFFFWAHGATLAAIVFLISAPGFRPRRGSILRMMIALNVYAMIVGIVDAATGWNYGYLCRKPAEPSLLDFLGPWPWYLLSLQAIAFVTFVILDLPWRIAERMPEKKEAG